MSFHKISPARAHKTAPTPKKKAAKKVAPKRRPVSHKG
ncbi:hypothetical protein RKD18_004072 [Streptomyces phaeoluteigriseus]